MVVARDKNEDNCAGRKPPRPVSAKRYRKTEGYNYL
jgi:hypothetical protein